MTASELFMLWLREATCPIREAVRELVTGVRMHLFLANRACRRFFARRALNHVRFQLGQIAAERANGFQAECLLQQRAAFLTSDLRRLED